MFQSVMFSGVQSASRQVSFSGAASKCRCCDKPSKPKESEPTIGAATRDPGVTQIRKRIDAEALNSEYNLKKQPSLFFKEEEIFGEQIKTFYNDVANRSPKNAVALIKAVELGIISAEDLKSAIDNIDNEDAKIIDVLDTISKTNEKVGLAPLKLNALA